VNCPFCGAADSRVLDSRKSDAHTIRRRRACEACSRRFTTYEKIETKPLIVVKKDGRREPFDGDKIMRGLIKACEKRPISMEKLEELAAGVEAELASEMEPEVSSEKIGNLVMERLKFMDEVAYVRFAAVYRSFRDVQTFLDELKILLDERPSTHGGIA